jgi:hypothetical protein
MRNECFENPADSIVRVDEYGEERNRIRGQDRNGITQRFPTLFHLRAPWQPISINCTLHISKMFVINIVAVISNIYVATVNK